MSEADLKAQFSLFGVEHLTIGDVTIRVPRVMTRGAEKAVAAALEAAADIQAQLNRWQRRLIELSRQGDDPSNEIAEIRRQATAAEDELRLQLIEAVKVIAIDDIPGLDDWGTNAITALMNAMTARSSEGLSEVLAKKFPTSGATS